MSEPDLSWVDDLLRGIDKDECESDTGWWETSTGADFGKGKLAELKQEIARRCMVSPDTSDGFHTFTELYHYRMLYNALLFNEWARLGMYDVHKSLRHSDNELCFGGGWFVVYAQLPTGQVSNHYEMADWGRFQVPARDVAAEWDGHSPQEAVQRMERFLDAGSSALTGDANG
jgi:hypothetical protein